MSSSPSGGVINRAAFAKHIERSPAALWDLILKITMKTSTNFSLLPVSTEERPFQFYSYLPSQQYQTITLKGRLEFRKDYRAILYAASQTHGIVALQFNNFEVEITWLSKGVSFDGEELDFWEDTQEYISTFVRLVKEAPDFLCFSELGLETHVFLQSLKPITQYDGKRNGCWANE